MRIATIAFIVAAVLLGMGLANVDSGTEGILDVLDRFSFDFEVPSLTLAGQATHVFVQAPAVSLCKETDDGDDPYMAGAVMITAHGRTQEFLDTCEGDVLLEYYCDGTRLHNYKKPCMYGCWQGVCRNAPMQTAADITSPDEQGVDKADMQAVQGALAPRWVEPADTSACKNGFRDGKESDVDCGGPCGPCSYSQMCKQDTDCESGLVCNYRSKRCLKTKY